MHKSVLRALVAAIGVYAIARSIGQFHEHLTAAILLTSHADRPPMVVDLLSGIAILAPALLVVAGLVLLIAPPAGLRKRIEHETSAREALARTAGLFIFVVGLEQVQAFGAAVGRTTETIWWDSSWGFVTAALACLVPLALIGLGLYRLRGRPGNGERPPGLSTAGALEIASVFTGTIILAHALPHLRQIIGHRTITFGEGMRPWIMSSHYADIATFTLEALIAVYLLFGAPHLAAWHARRSATTHEQSGQGQPQSGEPAN